MARPVRRHVQERASQLVSMTSAWLASDSSAGESRVLMEQVLQRIDVPLLDRINRRTAYGFVASQLHSITPTRRKALSLCRRTE